MCKKYDVVALGELLIDFTENGISSQGNPVFEANPGGAPCNVLSMLARLGHKVSFIGQVGNDMFGNQLEEAILKDAEVNTTLAFVHTLAGGDRDFSFYRKPGADMMLSVDDLKIDLLNDCEVFHFGTLSMTAEGCREATKKAIEVAKEAGAIISFDPNLREPLWESLDAANEQTAYGLSKCDVLKISDNEIQWFTGKEDYEAGVRYLHEQYNIKLILVSPAIIRQDTIETTGAGDTFGACILHQVLQKGLREYSIAELEEMLLFANAAASIVTTRKGTLRVMPAMDEIQELMRTNRILGAK